MIYFPLAKTFELRKLSYLSHLHPLHSCAVVSFARSPFAVPLLRFPFCGPVNYSIQLRRHGLHVHPFREHLAKSCYISG